MGEEVFAVCAVAVIALLITGLTVRGATKERKRD